jgi:glutamate 5-kinase
MAAFSAVQSFSAENPAEDPANLATPNLATPNPATLGTLPTLVIKIGTSSLTQPDTGLLALGTIAVLVETLSQLRAKGHPIVLVSSGAVGVGCARLGLTERPQTIALKQAVAAVGQGRLMRIYDDFFASLGQPIAQVLLTRGDFERRSSYLNIRRTFRKLLEMGVVPIVNENDTVAYDELKFGDNDTLSAQVADLVGAGWLFLLTDVDRLYTDNPRTNPEAQPIAVVEDLRELERVQTGHAGSQWGTGGMVTKIKAARIACMAGVQTVICHGQQPKNIPKIVAGESIGTRFAPQPRATPAWKRWIAHGTVPTGKLVLDAGAVTAIVQHGKSLLPAGIAAIEGEFQSDDAVLLCRSDGSEIARGLVNYSSGEMEIIRGHQSDEIPKLLGYLGAETVVHRDNLVLS